MATKGGEINMVPLYHNDERSKIMFFISGILILQFIGFSCIFFHLINKMNVNIIEQNQSIIGNVAKYDKDIAKKLVPIILDNDLSQMDIGKEMLDEYSYKESLRYYYNPLIPKVGYEILLQGLTLLIVTIAIVMGGLLYIINPLFKELKYLTFRAENVVENKVIKIKESFSYKGSLDKFILKFALMEERINNNINLLHQEKLNLKNIINDISHQLKTPLMALVMYNEILKDYKNMDSEDVDNFIDLSKEQLDRMEWLVKTLLKYARLESNVVEYHKKNFSLNNTIEESISALKIKAEEKNQNLLFKADKEVIFYHDRKWISEAISNIVKNAIEHTQEKGIISIVMEETPITIRIAIKDNGEGIEKKDLKKIFERFHKGENAVNPTSIGIGLCLSKSIIKAHDGDITVESQLGKGSTFYITFIKTAHMNVANG